MKLIDALSQIKNIGVSFFTTADAAVSLGIGPVAASTVLKRLAEAKHLLHLRRGLWTFLENPNLLLLSQYLTAPLPSYISLQTALYHHGMISQMSPTTFAVSLARTRFFETPRGSVSIHHISPEFFFGFETMDDGVQMATPEKALLDILYLSPARSGLFKSLPEVEIPKNFRIRLTKEMIGKIPSKKRQRMMTLLLEKLL